MSKTVFISYKSQNLAEVERLVEELEKTNLKTWYAPRDIPASKNYNMEILEVIEKKIDIMLVYVTPEIEDSVYIPKEIDRAISYSKKIIPVMKTKINYPKKVELLLSDIQWCDLSIDGYNGLVNSVLEAIEELNTIEHLSTPDLPTPVTIVESTAGVDYLLASHKIEKIQKTFVSSEAYEEALKRLQREPFLIVFNNNQGGKYTTAIQLSKALHADKIYEVSSEISPSQLMRLPVQYKSAYIINSDTLFSNWNIIESELEQWLQKLQSHQSSIIVCTNNLVEHKRLLPYYMQYQQHVDSVEAIQSHYTFQYEKPLSDQTVAVLKQANFSNLPLHEAVGLLELLNRFESGEIELTHLTGSLTMNAEKRVKEWLAANAESPNHIATMLAIVLYEGLSFEEIRDKRQQVVKLLNLEEEESHPIFEVASYLAYYNAYLKEILIYTDYGRDTLKVVELKFSEDRKLILTRLWNALTLSQKLELSELILLNSQHNRVKKRALQMLALLMEIDFNFFRNELVQPMMKEKEIKKRMFGIQLIEEYLEQTENYSRIWNLVKSWNGSTNYELQWSSLSLIKGTIGRVYLNQCLDQLYRSIVSDKRLHHSLFETLRKLYEFSKETNNEKNYFDSIVTWIEQANKTSDRDINLLIHFLEAYFTKYPELFYDSIHSHYKRIWKNMFNYIYRKRSNSMMFHQILLEGKRQDEQRSRFLIRFVQRYQVEGSQSSRERFNMYIKLHDLQILFE